MAPTQATQRMLSVAPATQGGATSKGVQTNSTKQIAAKARAPKTQSTKTAPVVRNTVQQQHHSWGSGTAGAGQPPTAKVQPKPVVQTKKADTTKVSSTPSQTQQKTSMLVAASPAPVDISSVVQVLCHANGEAADKPAVATTTPAKTVIPAIGTTADQPKLSLSSVPVTTTMKQQAIVKPHILTHVIEGFIIQEAAQPFPVRSLLIVGGKRMLLFEQSAKDLSMRVNLRAGSH